MKRLEQITLRQLRALQFITEHGTISAAAQAMGLTGPAVHSQLKTLEEAIGSKLIFREGKQRNSLTQQGQVLCEAEAQVRATLERAIRSIDALDKGRKGAVVLGAVSTAKYFAPRIVAKLDAAFPDIEVALKIANRSETITALQRGDYDLCIMGRPPRQPLAEAVSLADHPHVLIAPPDHPLAGRAEASDRDLCSERFILREPGSGTRMLAERYLDQLAETCTGARLEMDSNETIKQAVMNGLGVALISAHTVLHELASGRLVTLKAAGTPILRKWYLLTPMEFEPSTAARIVGDWIVENADRCFRELYAGTG